MAKSIIASFLLNGVLALSAHAAQPVHIVSWNMEWLDSAEAPKDVRDGCQKYKQEHAGHSAGGKCDKPQRIAADFAEMERYAKSVGGDVFAVQEVYNIAALKKIFPANEYDYWLSGYPQQQKTGIVVRKSRFAIEKGEDFQELGVEGGRVRYGADVTVVDQVSKQRLRLLSIHLKSGCFDQVLTAGGTACPVLRQQLPILEKWVEARSKEGQSFVVLGDFNRRLLWEQEQHRANYQDGANLWFWDELMDGKKSAELVNANTENVKPVTCGWESFSEFIDHILLSANLAPAVRDFKQVPYANQAYRQYVVSDHCAIMATLDF